MPRVVVIGAGIVGAGAAHRLAVEGADVTVIDDGRPGSATAAGAGIIAALSSKATDPATARLRIEAARYYLELVRQCDAAGIGGHSYAPVGQLTVALTDGDEAKLPTDLERMTALVEEFGDSAIGQPELLSAREIRSRYPLVVDTRGGLLLPKIARVDGDAMRRCLLQLAEVDGAKRITGTAALVQHHDRVVGVRTEQGVVYADEVIVAAGAWSSQLCPSVEVVPHRGQLLHLRMPGLSGMPTLDTYAGHYLLTFPDDLVVIGATREPGPGFITDGPDQFPTAGGMALVLAQGLSLVPALAKAAWIGPRVGFRPASPAGLPFLGRAPGIDGLWVATGMGPTGLTLGPYSGAMIADQVLGTAPEVHIRPADEVAGF